MNKDIENIINFMTSFYKDHLPLDSSYEKLLRVYIKSFLPLWEGATYLQNSMILEETPTLQKLHYVKIPIREAYYSKEQAERLVEIENFEMKIRELDRIGGFIQFTFSELGSRIPKVYDATVKMRFNDSNELVNYEDYFIRDNKLYIMPQFILRNDRLPNELHAFDVRIDDLMLEKKWGSFFEVEAGPLLPKHEYKTVLNAFRRLMGSRMTIKDIKESIISATGWTEFDVLDYKSPNLPSAIKKMYDEYKLSPAKFVVMIPEGLTSEKLKLNIVLSMLDEAKEEQTNYVMFFDINRVDNADGIVDVPHALAQQTHEDKNQVEDDTFVSQSYTFTERFFPQYNLYDEYNHFDRKLLFDAENHEHMGYNADDDPQLGDPNKPWGQRVEWFSVNHIEFPEIPREINATKEGEITTITFKTNEDGTTHYELWGSSDAISYTLLSTVPSSGAGSTSIIHNATSSQVRYYKVKATAGVEQSLFSLPIDRTTL